MKKFDLIHTTVLIVAILMGYSTILYIIALLSVLPLSADDLYHFRFASEPVYFFILSILNALACVILIRNASKYSALILKDDPEGSWEENTPKVDLDRRNIIFVLFVGMGLYTLIQAIPSLIGDGYQLFKTKVGALALTNTHSRRDDNIIIDLLRILVGAFLIYIAPVFTNYIDKTIASRLNDDKQSS